MVLNTNELLSVLKIKQIMGSLPDVISSIESDSRKVVQGTVFVCIKGYTVDGHDFIDSSIEKGATVIVAEKEPKTLVEGVSYVIVPNTDRALAYLANKFFDYPSKKLRIIGVTGTNGKTSITNAIKDVLRIKGYKVGATGTIEIDIDGNKIPSKNTTSDVLTTQKMLNEMVAAGVTDVIMEVSSHGLILGRLWGIEFQTAIFTNLTQDHLDFHETMENYKQAKGLLFSQLGQDLSQGRTAVLNADDAATEYYKTITSGNILTYGIENEADFRAINIEYFEDRTEFDLKLLGETTRIVIPFVGKFNVSNLLAVIASLYDKGLSLEEIKESIVRIRPASGRMERIKEDTKRNIFVDYAHTPDGVEKVLESVKMFSNPNRKIFFIIGTGGNRDTKKRPIMGRLATERADFVIFTTDNPRFEPWETIMEQMAGGAIHDNFECIGDRESAIFRAVELAQEGDTIVIAGKGHEKYQIIAGKEYPFDDKEVAIRAIERYPI